MNNLINRNFVNAKGRRYKVVKINTLFELVILMEQYRIDRKKAYKIVTLKQFNRNYKEW